MIEILDSHLRFVLSYRVPDEIVSDAWSNSISLPDCLKASIGNHAVITAWSSAISNYVFHQLWRFEDASQMLREHIDSEKDLSP